MRTGRFSWIWSARFPRAPSCSGMAAENRGPGLRNKSARAIPKSRSSSRNRPKRWRCEKQNRRMNDFIRRLAGFNSSARSMPALDDVGEIENREEHADDHAADDHAQEDNQHGFKERHEAGKRGFNFLVQKVRDALEHVVNVAGLFPGAQHAD